MSDDWQSLAEILEDQLDQIDEVGGSERHRLSQVIGRDAYDALISKARGADVVDRWKNASAKTKPAAIRALSVAIARVADKPQLVARIRREITDAFDEPSEAGSKPESIDSKPTSNNVRKPAVARKGGKPDLASLAKNSDLSEYMKVRQGE